MIYAFWIGYKCDQCTAAIAFMSDDIAEIICDGIRKWYKVTFA